ncbi:MAG: aldo/keto reductase [Candidatus Heimdallarchaeota archaeon]|nr:aldo/keto reductase [Candidatus Heimdallarchaeota archaeon]MDH5646799.1 aldo/keto reductase [Candidatus Heimdallarchaeota archaeon]
MNTRKIKLINKEVSVIGMGCFAIGGPFGTPENIYAYGEVNDDMSIRTIHKAIDMGVNLFDTADIYGYGRSERVLGEALKEYRDDVVIATKFANVFNESEKKASGKNTSPNYIRYAVKESLRRLQTDYIDIYQLHSGNHDLEDALKIRDTLEELVDEGFINSYGWSTDDVEKMSAFAKGNNCSSVQYALNVFHRNDLMVDLCNKQNITGLIRSPLASGTLTLKYTPETHDLPKDHMLSTVNFNSERFHKRHPKLIELKQLFQDHDRTLIQGLISWILSHDTNSIPIPGAKNLAQIEENAKVVELGPLNNTLKNHVDELVHDVLGSSIIKN